MGPSRLAVHRRPPSRSVAVAAVAAVVAFGMAVGASGCADGESAREFVGYRTAPSQAVGDLDLPDAAAGGAPFRFDPDPEHLQIVYFGYTSCPDVCPTSLAAVRNALRDLGEDADRIDLAMVTVDPGRDTEQVLTRYVHSFVDGAHALRTTDASALAAVADTFGASYSVEVTGDGVIEVAHSGSMFVVAPGGSVTLTWPFGVTADDIAGDLELLLSEVDA